MKLKYILFGLIWLGSCWAKDLGRFGETFVIVEEDLLKIITRKLEQLNQNGDLLSHQLYIQNKIKQRVLEPVANNLPETVNQRVFYYDPTITVAEDLKDHRGNIFKLKGEKINPLNHYSFKEPWLFFDLSSSKQKEFAINELKHKKLKLILTRGRPLELMQELNQSVYFDQSGWLVKKFKIKQLPALVEQQGDSLKITEMELKKCQAKN